MTFTPREVHAYFAARFPKLNWTTAKQLRMPCPIHQGTNPNFAIDAETGLCHCHSACGRGWDMISLEQDLTGLDFPRAKDRVFETVGRPKVPWEERNVQAIYEYTDEHGKLLYQVLRYVDKQFKQRRPNGEPGKWIWGLAETKRVPFRLERLINSDVVFVTEGERDVLTVERLGQTGTCNSGGAGNFKPELVPYFTGKHVAIFPDNDEPGRDHALKVAALLAPVAKSLKIVELPDLPNKGDITDFVNAGGTIDAIREIYRKSQHWTPEWEFSSNIPHENDRYVRTMLEEVELAGGPEKFWDLASLTGLQTPWKKLSRALGGGLRPGEVYVLGANQGAGKTSLALQFILHSMQRNEAPLLFSMEMGWRAVFQRMTGIHARVNLLDLREAQITLRRRTLDEEVRYQANAIVSELGTQLAHATKELVTYPYLVHTKSAITPETIVEETTRLKKRQKIQLVVIDHMQLMSSTGNPRSDYEKFTAISRSVKQVATELAVPVLIVSQTSRSQARDHRGEIEVSDLRGSGAIEEDAAGVFLLFEDKADRDLALSEGDGSRYTKGPVKCWLKLGKNRYGEQGKCFELWHHKASTRFEAQEDM